MTKRLAIAAVLACLVTPAHAEEWRRFTNARYGASAEMPYHLLPGLLGEDITDGRPGSMN